MGRQVVNGEKLALAQSHGTAGKFGINFSVLNSTDPKRGTWTPPTVAANARRASEDKSTIAYLGEVEPSASAVSVIFLNEAQTLQVSPTDTFAGLTQREGDTAGEPDKYYPAGEHTYARMVPTDAVQAQALLAWMRDLGLRRLTVVYDNALYGRGLAEELAAGAKGAGLTLAGKAVIAPPGNAAKAVDAVRAEHPDAIFYGGTPGDRPGGLWDALAKALPHAQIFAPGAMATPDVAQGAGAAADRLHITSPALPMRYYGAAARSFARAYRLQYGIEPGPWAIYGYEAMSSTIAAIRRAGSHAQRRQAVIDAFFRHRDATATSAGAFAGYKIEDGRLVFDRMLPANR
jgi:branched-chain amino acid transport system substrate-binding protein